MFIELLESFRLDDQYIQPFVLQLKKTFVGMRKQSFEDRDAYAKQIKALEAELDKLHESMLMASLMMIIYIKDSG